MSTPEQNISTEAPQNQQQLTEYVRDLLNQVSERFGGMCKNILFEIDEMNNRLNELEGTVTELLNASTEETTKPETTE
eukprot:TRINITY_DN1897_c0_g1_i1.p2 TRINITY_DN1897_c0_g1~~TRINITY_DN1897_c0_g1_i1.p2  ORF type:complete len:78 (+),score=32.10 TRINITY_DN1897_c0_g1_i1:50-283(+)